MFKVKLLSPEGISLAANNAPSVLDMDCESVDDSYQHDEVTEDNDYIITTNESQVRCITIKTYGECCQALSVVLYCTVPVLKLTLSLLFTHSDLDT